MKTKLILLLIILFFLNSCSQKKKDDEPIRLNKLSEQTKNIVKEIIEYGEVTGRNIGVGGTQSKQWDNFMKLKETANEEELLFLLKDSSPVVKCYVFDILVNERNENVFKILKQNLKDTTAVLVQSGCILRTERVNEYFIESVLRPNYKGEYLTKSDKNRLDSLILFTPNLISENKNRLIEEIAPKEKYYDRIKGLVLQENRSAVIAISKYQKESDVQFINELLENKSIDIQCYGLRAVKNFPHEKFFEKIKAIHTKEIKIPTDLDYSRLGELYQSIVSFKNKNSRELLERTIEETDGFIKKYHSEFIWLALRKYPNDIYNEVYKQLNYTENEIADLENRWSWLLEKNINKNN